MQQHPIFGFDLFGIGHSFHPTGGINYAAQQEQDQISAMLAVSPTGAVYGQIIKWCPSPGREKSVSVHSFYERDARKSALRSAIRSGYTRPRWWQWWRWGETRINMDFTK